MSKEVNKIIFKKSKRGWEVGLNHGHAELAWYPPADKVDAVRTAFPEFSVDPLPDEPSYAEGTDEMDAGVPA